MEISLIPSHKNRYVKNGILVRGAAVHTWLEAMQVMALSPENCEAYAIPERHSARFFGCLLIPDKMPSDTFSHNICQLVRQKLFIPDYADIVPKLSDEEWGRHFPDGRYLFFPETGFFALETRVDWHSILTFPVPTELIVQVPAKPVSIPSQIKVLMVEQEAKPEDNPFDEKEFIENLPFNMKKVLKGNQREIDKYLKFLDENPEAALKYAIPLDVLGKNRGSNTGRYVMNGSSQNTKRLFFVIGIVLAAVLVITFMAYMMDSNGSTSMAPVIFLIIMIVRVFSGIFGGSSTATTKSSGSFLVNHDRFQALKERYTLLARQYENKGDYRKAAHIYHKLLENPFMAAETLEKGKLYAEAGQMYLKFCDNREKAAACFREAKMYGEATRLYLKMDQFEEAADLLFLMGDKAEASKYYKKTIEGYIQRGQYIKASLIYSKKMDDFSSAQQYLLEGWEQRRDGADCLVLYFSNIKDEEKLKEEILRIYHKDKDSEKAKSFLSVLKKGFENRPALQPLKKELAYEIVAAHISSDVNLASELIFFNREDTVFVKDVMKYKLLARKRN